MHGANIYIYTYIKYTEMLCIVTFWFSQVINMNHVSFESFIAPTNAQHINIKTLIFFTLKYITIAPTCFGFD